MLGKASYDVKRQLKRHFLILFTGQSQFIRGQAYLSIKPMTKFTGHFELDSLVVCLDYVS